MPALVNAKS